MNPIFNVSLDMVNIHGIQDQMYRKTKNPLYVGAAPGSGKGRKHVFSNRFKKFFVKTFDIETIEEHERTKEPIVIAELLVLGINGENIGVVCELLDSDSKVDAREYWEKKRNHFITKFPTDDIEVALMIHTIKFTEEDT